MKVALLVFPLHYSHGCILQTYALYSKLKELGHDVIILDRQPNQVSILKWCLKVLKRMARYILKGYRGAVFYRGWFPKIIMIRQQPFIDIFKKDIITTYSTEALRQIVIKGKYDVIVVGSDQTWRPQNVSNVMDYWLAFANDIPVVKIAYAPSFGVDKWEYTKSQTIHCKELARKFQGISVREESGVRLCRENLGINVKHVLDPTMLWDKTFYSTISGKYPIKSGGCQCYFLDLSQEKINIANQISNILKLEINYINTETENGNAPLNKRVAPSVEKWLAGFHYGDFIVVDSFHAMVFSIIYQKPFVVIGNAERGMSRFESLLNELGLTRRLLSDKNSIPDVIDEKIDWDDVNVRLTNHRNTSIMFLIDMINKK